MHASASFSTCPQDKCNLASLENLRSDQLTVNLRGIKQAVVRSRHNNGGGDVKINTFPKSRIF